MKNDRCYDRKGNPITYAEWERLFSNEDYKRVALFETGDVSVSTVWLGLDYNWLGSPPLIFETMIFGGDRDSEQWRWPTEAAAIAGHDQIAAELREEVNHE